MENMFVWVLIFAGAAIALLGLFLVASERELKNKRLEIESLAAKLGDSQANQTEAPVLLTQPVDSEEVAELQAKNQELQKENANLAAKLELGRRAIEELESAERREPNAQADTQELRAANEALSGEIKALQEQIQAYEARLKESAAENRDAAEQQRRLQNDLAELQERLATSESNIRDLESSQQRLANTESLEATHAEELRQWQTRIADLERQLADARVNLGESDALRQQLAEAEKLRQDLEAENLRYEEEVPRWQARIVEAEENRRRLSGLREPFDALLTKHAEIAERQNRFGEDLAAFGGLIALPVNLSADNHAAEASVDNRSFAAPATGATRATTTASFQAAALADRAAKDDDDRSAIDESGGPITSAQLAAGGPTNKQRKRRFGLFGLIVLLPVAVAFAFGNWQSPVDRANLGTVKTAAAPAGKADSGQVPAKPQDSARAAKESFAAAKPSQTARPETKISGTYEITQASRVYAAPTEFSTLIADIEPGVKVYVANARDGWLEIHSKHGRPPGYIRKEAAARITGQN